MCVYIYIYIYIYIYTVYIYLINIHRTHTYVMQTKTFVLYVINRDLSFDSTINKNIRNKIDVN